MLDALKKDIDKTLQHLEKEFGKIQLGRATPTLVEDVQIEVYWWRQPIKNSASINILDTQTLSIDPWDKSLIHTIAKAISDAGIGLNPQTMADSILIKVPPLTEERRIEVGKIVKKFAEEAKVSIRNIRWEVHKKIKRQETNKEISEDQARDLENDLQKMIDAANTTIDEANRKKEEDIMKI